MYIPQEQQEYSSITVNVSIDGIAITKKEELKEETENTSKLTELQPNTSLVKTKLRGKMIEKVEINKSEVLDKIKNISKLNELYVNKIFNESNKSTRMIIKFKKNTTKQMKKNERGKN